jgi:hypothetical protein
MALVILNESENIGDDIQALATSKFYSRILDYTFRDNIKYDSLPAGSNVIINGWFNSHPESLITNRVDINILFVSVYFSNYTKKMFRKRRYKALLSRFEPIGARDLTTADYLTSIGIKNYFSGCVILTLLSNDKIIRNDRALLVDVDDGIKKKVEETIRVDQLSQVISPHITGNDRLRLASYYLHHFNSYKLVITSRLHVALPCLAIGTPVVLVRDINNPRFNGLKELVMHFTPDEFMSSDLDLLNIVNPSSYREISLSIEDTLKTFTGYSNPDSLIPEEIDNINLMSLLNMNNENYLKLRRFFLKRLNFAYLFRKIKEKYRIR